MKRAGVQHESLAANTRANFLLLQEQKRRERQDNRAPSAASLFIQTFILLGGGTLKIKKSPLPERPDGHTRDTK